MFKKIMKLFKKKKECPPPPPPSLKSLSLSSSYSLSSTYHKTPNNKDMIRYWMDIYAH